MKTISLPLLALLVSCEINPVSGNQQLMLISEKDEIEMGRDAEPQVVREFSGVWEDPSLSSYISSVGHKIARVSQRNYLAFKFGVLNSDVPNAFALPGGIIYITRGLLVRLENEAQLAGVLGHEVGHVCARHSAAQISKAYLGLILVAGAASYAQSKSINPDVVSMAGQVTMSIIMQGYSRGDEMEADREGAKHIYALGYNPDGMIQVFEVLKKVEQEHGGDKTPTIFRSHPATDDRIKEMKAILPRKYPDWNNKNLAKEAFDKNTFSFKANYASTAKEFDQAVTRFREKKYSEAFQHINIALANMPGNSMFHILKGIIYEAESNHHEAVQSFSNAIRCNPSNYDGHLGHGKALFHRSQYHAAETSLRKAISLVYQIPDAHGWLAKTLERQGRMREAQEEIRIYQKLKRE